MNIMQATDIATDGNVAAQIRARLAAGSTSDATSARLMLEIALLALAETARLTEDETEEQEALDDATQAVADAIEMVA